MALAFRTAIMTVGSANLRALSAPGGQPARTSPKLIITTVTNAPAHGPDTLNFIIHSNFASSPSSCQPACYAPHVLHAFFFSLFRLSSLAHIPYRSRRNRCRSHSFLVFVPFYLLVLLIFGLLSCMCDIIYILKQYTPTPSYLLIIDRRMDGIGHLFTPRVLSCVSLRAESIR